MTHVWDPERYQTFSDERARPFHDLLSRIPQATASACAVRSVVDLGCGPGGLTAVLSERWPQADVVGVDSSPQMIAATDAVARPGLHFEQRDLRDWLTAASGDGPGAAPGHVDVLVSNATLQWVPDHLALMPALVAAVAPGGWLAIQVPGNFTTPSHTLLHELAQQAPYAEHVSGLPRPSSAEPVDYLSALAGLGCRVDVWETTYQHVLTGPDPVFAWMSGTGARPILAALPVELRERFELEYKERLRAAYPERAYGVVLPFRRIFVVAQTPAG